MLGGIAEGTTTVRGLLEGEDVLCTIAALKAMGAAIHKDAEGVWHVKGVGPGELQAPAAVLDVGNSGTSARLLMGLVSGYAFPTRLTGDASLQKRPMRRVMEPLSAMGVRFESTDGRLPVTIMGSPNPQCVAYRVPVASAQVKSAIMLAALRAAGVSTVIEPAPTRDHTENMLRSFGAHVAVESCSNGTGIVSVAGGARLKAQDIEVPSDFSSAAFPLVAALLCPDSRVALRNIGLNRRRAGLIEVLREMGAHIEIENLKENNDEPVGDLIVSSSELSGVDIPGSRAPCMIDEYPILSVAAACAKGITRMRGLGELRVKESDRLSLMAQGLSHCGARMEIEGDDLIVHGTGHPPEGGVCIATAMDHRIAMSFLVLGMRTAQPVRIDDGSFIATSFPDFAVLMNRIGAKILNPSSSFS